MVDLFGAAEFQEPSVTGMVVTLCGPHTWRISKATPANVRQASVLPHFYSSGCLCLLPGFLLQALVMAWYQVRPSLTGLPGLGALPPQCSPWMT